MIQFECKEIPNINRLDDYIGKSIGYKAITELLEIKYYKGGNSKQKQIDIIQQYYEIEKDNRRYIVTDKHKEAILYTDNNQSIYYNSLEVIILHALQNSKREVNIWSTTEALIVTTLLNKNYRISKRDLETSAAAIEVDKEYLFNFTQLVNKRFKGIFESTLKRMSNKKLINYEVCTMIYKRIPQIKLNDAGVPIIDDKGHILYTTDKKHMRADEHERAYITRIEKEVLNELSCAGVDVAIAKGLYNEYTRKVNAILKEKLNIEFYYKAYNIVHNKNHIHEAISELKQTTATNSLNSIKINALNSSSNKTLNKSLDDKEICIDILVNKYPTHDLAILIKNYISQLKDNNDISDQGIPF